MKKSVCLFLTLAIMFLAMPAWCLPFTNGDFENGFSNWKGFASDFVTDAIYDPIPEPDLFGNFNLETGLNGSTSAVLAPDFLSPILGIYQDFDMATPFHLTFDYAWLPDDVFDSSSVLVRYTADPGTILETFFLDPNVSGMADFFVNHSGNLQVEFQIISDELFSELETLTLDSIQTIAPVPEPSTLLLLGSGLAILAGLIRHRRIPGN